MEFLCNSERFELMGPPRPSRLGRPPAVENGSKEENPNFVEFDQEQRSHYPPTGSDLFQETINEMDEGIPVNDSRPIQQFSRSQTASIPVDKTKLDEVGNVKIGKRRLAHSQSRTLKHSDARLPEVAP